MRETLGRSQDQSLKKGSYLVARKLSLSVGASAAILASRRIVLQRLITVFTNAGDKLAWFKPTTRFAFSFFNSHISWSLLDVQLVHRVAAVSSSLQFNLGAGMGPDGLTLPANRTPWERPCLPGNTMQGSVGGVRYDQPDAQHAALLEAGIQSTRTHNVHLQHKVAFLEARMIGQLGHIAKLQMRVKALESELSSLRANVGFGPYPVSASSNGADSVAASPVVAGTIPPPSPASAYAQDHRWSLIGQQHEPAPPNPAAPGVVGNYAEWNLGAKHVDGPGTGSAVYPQTESGAVPVARSPSPTQAPDPAAFDEFQVDAPSSTQAASAETGCAVVPEQAENPSSCNNATPTTVAASAMPRHPLHDFWVDNSHDNSDNPLPSNTRNRDLQGELQAYGTEDDIARAGRCCCSVGKL